MHNTVY